MALKTGEPSDDQGGNTQNQSIAQQVLGSAAEAASVKVLPNGQPTLPGYSSAGPPTGYAARNAQPNINDPFWKGLPDEYKNQLEELEHQFQSLAGFNVKISNQDLINMAHSRVLDLFSFGQYMWQHMSADIKTNMPWLQFGLSSEAFHMEALNLSRAFEQLTGKTPTQDVLTQAFQQQFPGGSLGARDYQTFLQNDANMQKLYPWLKFGYNYRDFQQHKAEMRLAFGFDLNDEEAAKQLTYYHASSPDFYAASATAPQKSSGQSPQTLGNQQVAR